MGSPLGPTLANAFMCYFESIWLKNFRSYFKPIVYRFVDGIILLFLSKNHVRNLEIVSINNITV